MLHMKLMHRYVLAWYVNACMLSKQLSCSHQECISFFPSSLPSTPSLSVFLNAFFSSTKYFKETRLAAKHTDSVSHTHACMYICCHKCLCVCVCGGVHWSAGVCCEWKMHELWVRLFPHNCEFSTHSHRHSSWYA